MFQNIKKSWEDFFSLKMIALNLLPIIIGIAFWSFILFYFGNQILTTLEHILPTSWKNLLENPGFFASIGGFFIKTFLYLLLAFFVIILTIIGNIFISIFYTPIVIGYLRKKYYPDIFIHSFGGIKTSIFHFLKSLLWLILFVAILSPLFFIPVVGVFAVLIPHFFFFKNTMLFDVGSSIFNESEYHSFLSKNRVKIYQISLIAYIFSLIPFFNFFATLLQTIIISRFVLDKKEQQNL
ncbi:EI24 domain-containing protein [Helicobacter cappadocius]|uniref:EI24 domain-containing protein n=1 Tax=Helicobacter cappadocius TaxID=3063998 RepID=A0AA90PWN3_9HELI|nr:MULTISPECIES: EI24 domain-containing protein [unclassified Helicobacter]MDO7253692.1 EI24 domain-containing protein [Helicobacter sp. faydin-H75]MDP2539620.1 EI24 domain-containing protein [Helicobacter sp. faydin-H76]